MKSFNVFLTEAASKARRGMQHAIDVANALVSGIGKRDTTFSVKPDLFDESGHGQIQTPTESGSLYKPQTRYGIKIGKPTANGSDATVFTHVWNGKKWSTTEHPVEIAQGNKTFSRYNETTGKQTSRDIPDRKSRRKLLFDPYMPISRKTPDVSQETRNISRPGIIKNFGILRQLAKYNEITEPTISFGSAETNRETKTPSGRRTGTPVLINLENGNLRSLSFDKIKDDQPIYSRQIRRKKVEADPSKKRKGRNVSQDVQLSITDVERMMGAHDEHTSKGVEAILAGLEKEHSRMHD
jgi:hypothetical protein